MPGRLDAIMGQTGAIQLLQRALSSGRIPHALVIDGPDGIGKRTAAEATAAALLCSQPDDGGACGRCPACAKLDADAHPDLVRVTPNEKNNIRIDEVRTLEHAIRLRAMEGGRKVAIVLDAHRLNTSAQNGLLKTLEEPPANTHVLLVTDRPGALLPTILSRCQTIRLRPLSRELVKQVIARVAPNYDDDARRTLAAFSEGAPGRALSLDLDLLFARRDRVLDLDERIDPCQPRAAIDAIDEAQELAKDRGAFAELIDAWTVWCRDQALIAAGGSKQSVAHPDHLDTLRAVAERRGLEVALARSEALLEARRQIDLPFNLNTAMIAEQLLLTLSGHIELRRVPLRIPLARNP